MNVGIVLQLSFENVAGHISNLEEVRSLVDEISSEASSLEEAISFLERRMEDAEVTLITDIRILVNEIHHRAREKSP